MVTIFLLLIIAAVACSPFNIGLRIKYAKDLYIKP